MERGREPWCFLVPPNGRNMPEEGTGNVVSESWGDGTDIEADLRRVKALAEEELLRSREQLEDRSP